jgi:hypothetical protein
MVSRAPNIQALIITVSYTFDTLAAVWIYADATARRANKPLFASLAVLLLGPLWLSFYMTDRPLRRDERRRGGFGWNWMRNLAIAWTAATAPWLGVAAFAVARGDVDAAVRRLTFAAAGWLVPILVMMLVGSFLRRADSEESGGPAPARTSIPLAAVSALAVILTFAILTALFARAA